MNEIVYVYQVEFKEREERREKGKLFVCKGRKKKLIDGRIKERRNSTQWMGRA